MNVPELRPTMTTVPVRVQRAPTVSPTSPPVQLKRVPQKSPGGITIPARKYMPPRPVRPSLDTWRHDLRLQHTCAAVVYQLVIQEHLNHLYHPVKDQHKTYDKLKL